MLAWSQGRHGQQGDTASGRGTAGELLSVARLRLELSGPESSGGCLSSTLKSLTKAGLNDQKFHLIGQIKK